MRPDFGAGLSQFVFEPVNPTTLARVEARVSDSLIAWEPRIDIDQVAGDPGRIGPADRAVLPRAGH